MPLDKDVAQSWQCINELQLHNKLPQTNSLKSQDFLDLYSLKNDRIICSFSRQIIQYHGNPSLSPNGNADEAEVEQFYEDLQDLLERTPQKDVLFILGDWNAKVRSQETPGVTGKFGLGM